MEKGVTFVDDLKKLSQRIYQLRAEHGLSQKQLAQRLGVTSQAVSKWENEQSWPDISLLSLICDVFQITLDDLFARKQKNASLREGLVAEYLFDGNAQDTSGNHYHGKVYGGRLCADRFGRENRAYYFNGKDSYIVVDPPPQISENAFSISFWCKYAEDTQLSGWRHAILSQDGHRRRRVFQFSTYDHHLTFHRFLQDPDLSVDTPVQANYWYYITVTYHNHTFYLYQNGLLVNKQEGTISPNDLEALYIGRKATDEPYFYFHGIIDDIRIYHRQLSADEVNKLWLENNWQPQAEPLQPDVQKQAESLLSCVEAIQMTIDPSQIKQAVNWYVGHLNFKVLMDQDQQFYMLSLYQVPNLIIESHIEKNKTTQWSPFIFKSKWQVEQIKNHLTNAQAKITKIEDKGFAYFIYFKDPFDCNWIVMSER